MAFNKNGKWYGAGLVLVGAVIGVALVSAGTSVVHWSGSTEFCGTFCHSMDAAYASYKKGQHAQTFSGAKAECVDCHLKYESVHSISQAQVVGLLWHKAVSGSNSLWGEIRGTLSTPEKQIEKREEMAESVQKWMVSVDYVTCRGCHDIGNMKVNPAKPMVAPMHKAFADQPKTDCVACHRPATSTNNSYGRHFRLATPARLCRAQAFFFAFAPAAGAVQSCVDFVSAPNVERLVFVTANFLFAFGKSPCSLRNTPPFTARTIVPTLTALTRSSSTLS